VIVDSGVWIDHFTDRANRTVEFLRNALDEGEEVFVLPVIVQEVLQGTHDTAQFRRYAKLLAPLPLAPIADQRSVAVQAANLYARLRWKGLTVPPTDCLIAASALASRNALLTTDADFKAIAGIRSRFRLIEA
jgi:predicted nucleic acid-binding protein